MLGEAERVKVWLGEGAGMRCYDSLPECALKRWQREFPSRMRSLHFPSLSAVLALPSVHVVAKQPLRFEAQGLHSGEALAVLAASEKAETP